MLQCLVAGVAQGGVLVELAALAGPVDAHEILVDHPARADVGMADLRVSHLSLGESHREPGRLERRHRIVLGEMLEVGRGRQRDGIALALTAQAKAIQHDEEDLLGLGHAWFWGEGAGTLFRVGFAPQDRLATVELLDQNEPGEKMGQG